MKKEVVHLDNVLRGEVVLWSGTFKNRSGLNLKLKELPGAEYQSLFITQKFNGFRRQADLQIK
jgi:hypothetical protein